MSDIDLEEISIISFETAERKPEEAEVEMVEVRAGRAAERERACVVESVRESMRARCRRPRSEGVSGVHFVP